VADADAALARHAGQEADRNRELPGLEAPEELGEDCDLLRARPRLGQIARGGDEIGQQGQWRRFFVLYG
jgi:hypothetical protein